MNLDKLSGKLMAQSFESRLADASSKEAVKAAKMLLKNGWLVCAYKDTENNINAVFNVKNCYEYVNIAPGENSKKCTCNANADSLCEHAVAAIMHYARFAGHPKPPPKEGKAEYSGLKLKNIEELFSQENTAPVAEVKIQAESAFPHVPSKWENAVLSVKLVTDKKEYVGNLNNLRQLYFSKTLAVSLKLAHFSLQDRQIIRFLAINAEPESSKLLLNSEQTAEFFHSLVDFDRFTRDDHKLIVHREAATPAIIRRKVGEQIMFQPAVWIDQALLPVKSAKVITGRSGCWLGIKGEYWWVPGTLDVSWLRNFFRCGEQQLNSQQFEKMLDGETFPVEVVDAARPAIRIKKCKTFIGGGFSSEKIFQLNIAFGYDERWFAANQGRLESDGKRFWHRDEAVEKSFADALRGFGFLGGKSTFQLEDPEAAGVFLDKTLPMWLASDREVYIDATLVRLGVGRLPEVTISCKLQKSLKDKYVLHYELRGGTATISWNNLLKAVKAGKKYFLAAPDCLVKTSDAFRGFLLSAANTLNKVDEKTGSFELPRCAAHYWKYIARDVPGAVPPELAGGIGNDADSLNDTALEFQGSERFKGTLRHYQEEGTEWLRRFTDNSFNVILADEMGLGKTVQALAMMASRVNRESGPAMVICPASLVENWKRESERFVPDFKAAAMASGSNDRSAVWQNAGDYDLIIASYAIARRDADKLKNIKFSYLVLDEAQHIKNPSTVNAQSCKAINAAHRLVLTGTPLENSSDDLWSIFDFLHPGMLGAFNSFRKYYSGIREDRKLQDDLSARITPFIKRRTKAKVCQELPPKQEQTLFCEMDKSQRALYNEMLETGRKQLNGLRQNKTGKNNFEILTTLLRLRQICCHPGLLPDNQGDNVASAKLELLEELALQNIDSGHKMLLFSQFTSLLAVIRAWLDKRNIAYEYLDGSTRNRQRRVDNFNNSPEIPVFLLSLKAGGVGLNLTSADTVIIYDPWWNPAVEMQATDRTHRIGQTRPVNSLKLVVKDSIEEKILALQSKKQEIFDNVIENPAACGDKFSLEDIRFILN